MNAVAPDVGELWRARHDRLVAFVRRHIPNTEDADDVIQDAFLRAQVGFARAGHVDDVDAWLFTVARSAVADWHRRRGHPAPVDVEDVAAPPDEEPDAVTALAACVRPFVAQLPDRYREAVALVDLDDVRNADAAAQLGLSVSGMKSRVQRGRLHLRGLLDACCDFEVDRRGHVVEAIPKGCACADFVATRDRVGCAPAAFLADREQPIESRDPFRDG